MPEPSQRRNSRADPGAAGHSPGGCRVPELGARGSARETDAELTDDALAGDFRVYQRRRGHRYSLDDVATAYLAANACPAAASVLDLGSGIGSVLLMLAYKLPRARLAAVEAQAESYELLCRNVARNGVAPRCRLLQGDFRTADMLEELAAARPEGFSLVTGTPPYMPRGRGPISPDPQRAHARVELRGGVEDYLAAAARVLAPGGRIVICADARRPERVCKGARAAGLSPLSRTDVVPIASHKQALFSIFVLARSPAGEDQRGPGLRRLSDLIARDADGARSAQAIALRRFFGLPVGEREPPSPRLRPRGRRAPAR